MDYIDFSGRFARQILASIVQERTDAKWLFEFLDLTSALIRARDREIVEKYSKALDDAFGLEGSIRRKEIKLSVLRDLG